MLSEARIYSLLEKVKEQRATPEECEELLLLLDSKEQDTVMDQMNEFFRSRASFKDSLTEFEEVYWKSAAKQVTQVNYPPKVILVNESGNGQLAAIHALRSPRNWRWAAASIVITLGIGVAAYWQFSSKTTSSVQQHAAINKLTDIGPGVEKAVLTLADGTQILLDSSKNGHLAQQGGSRVVKRNDGQLAYEPQINTTDKIVLNTLTVPRGGQYSLTLADGTNVWLNAASSIRYPTSFTGSDRVIEIAGEAYMEIAKNAKQPFRVKANGTEVIVLGTSFNVNAYADENTVKTTLIDGAVKVVKTATGGNVLLQPGEQVQVEADKGDLKVERVNTEEVIAWRNGLFSFNNADVKTIMRQLSRWYDINVVYENGIPTQRFYGEMNRNLTLSQVLKGLEVIKINCKIEGRNLIVLP